MDLIRFIPAYQHPMAKISQYPFLFIPVAPGRVIALQRKNESELKS